MINDREAHIKILIDSYKNLTGLSLIPSDIQIKSLVNYFDTMPFVLLSHGTEPDPILNYGNYRALELWEMSESEFLKTPSRKTAEEPLREERQKLLQRVTEYGYIDDYSGIRISKTGKRFKIKKATVWNVHDSLGKKIGQAATFSEWEYL